MIARPGRGGATLAGVVAMLLVSFCPSALATPGDHAIRWIQFKAGAESAVVTDAVVRGERRTYGFRARRGQPCKIVISAIESNAVFRLISISPTGRGGSETMIAGPEARAWSGVLPSTGTYRIIVSGTRGNASYRLRLRIKSAAQAVSQTTIARAGPSRRVS